MSKDCYVTVRSTIPFVRIDFKNLLKPLITLDTVNKCARGVVVQRMRDTGMPKEVKKKYINGAT